MERMSLAVVRQLDADHERGGIWYLSGHRDHVLSIAASSHGVFATCDAKGLGLLWKHDTSHSNSDPSHVSRISSEGPAIVAACFPSSTRLCTAQGNGRVGVWDIEASTEVQSLSRLPSRGKSVNWPVINALSAWESDLVAYGGDDGYLVLSSLAVRNPVVSVNLRVPITSVAAAATSLLVGDVLGNIRCFDTRTFKSLYCFQGHRGVVTSVSVKEDASLAVSYGMDDSLALWNALPFSLTTEDRLIHRGEFHQGDTKTLLRCDWATSGAALVPVSDGRVVYLSAPTLDGIRTILPGRHRREPAQCAAFIGDGYAVSSAETEVILQRI
ncbi:U5 snRNP-specific 40 kDa protein [Trypanosoma equiperdum]|uniref:Uncharacterized protein n=4 Tax=Trypanozoon TaxID=39700 RepID=Q383G3_TRYB2|nr:hypothetical protein, conserved [Trypanosoma brucei gambiense DAL972]XP_829180.1 hypothetical protein, conserved [Trypanosoma brucei brucei TREU927]RHW67512.1 U5 snRNP-specific 40 kDa protein [Trypanosoma brucei equiperdum]SCU70218.1 U5 snRNP-specific 40 kDa protein [Trypanosoma equiperdum]EAN80068.1 hypothetical protein, conserved [Trypanosoma brucei brucei TREU927]CBH18129.1 hypothetical protein, conserved [Trypanosoma brucei gambiense DAL972]|eukprot:XP_011780393.1 hypothetical protein, conserved [Trypanosoma brucei gambiense DAL972]